MTNFSSKIYAQSANLDQIRNGPLGVYATTPIADWVNGNAGPQNAHFAEGYSIPYRARVSGLVGNANTVHHLIIEWDTKHGNGHALDYITHYQNLDNPVGSHATTFGHGPEAIIPTLGTAFSGAPTELEQIPAPSSSGSEVNLQPTNSFNALPASTGNSDITKMAIWGGTIVSLTYVFEDAPDGTTAQTETRLDIAFTSANGSTALLAWGGHIAAEYDWGPGRGATGVSGSPYHTRVIEIDGKPGNQDRSLKATAVIIPPAVCGISPAQLACPETTSLTFDATGSSTGVGISYVWTLTEGSTPAGAQISGSNTGFSITVVPDNGTNFIEGGTFNLSLTVNKTGAQSTTCTREPAGTIIKTVVTAAADPTVIDLTSAAHNTTLTANIGAASTFPLNTDYSYQWSIVTGGTSGSLTNDATRIATYTAATNDPTSITFKVVATLIATGAPACKDSAQVTVTLTGGPPCTVSPSDPVCQGTQNVHNGPSPIPANATYTWSTTGFGGSGTTTSSPVGATNGVSVTINAIQSYRVVLTQTFANPALNTSCHQDVTVIPTPTVSAIYNPPGCTETTFSIDIPNSVSTSSYKVTQGVSPNFTYNQTKAGNNGTLNFAGLAAGGGFEVEVTTGTASCKATTNCASSTNSCTNGAITENRGGTTPQTSAAKEPETYKVVLESPTKVNATPNPYTEKVRFDLVSGVSGYGTLELYNTVGQRIGIVYQGHIQAGRPLVRDYSITKGSKSTVIYVFKVGDQKVTGKLLNLK